MAKYELLKPISLKALEEAWACERELHRFAFLLLRKRFLDGAQGVGLNDELKLKAAIAIASQCEGCIPFLIEKGFIREVDEVPELKPCPYCKKDKVEHFNSSPGRHYIFCLKCNLGGPHCASKDIAFKAWNDLPR